MIHLKPIIASYIFIGVSMLSSYYWYHMISDQWLYYFALFFDFILCVFATICFGHLPIVMKHDILSNSLFWFGFVVYYVEIGLLFETAIGMGYGLMYSGIKSICTGLILFSFSNSYTFKITIFIFEMILALIVFVLMSSSLSLLIWCSGLIDSKYQISRYISHTIEENFKFGI